MKNAVFSVDIGTSSLKAAVVSTDGTVLSASRIRFPLIQRTVFHWLEALATAWAQTTIGYAISAICVSGNGPTIVSLDAKDFPNALFLWNDIIKKQNNTPKTPETASLFIPRIIAFKQQYPKEFIDAKTILSGPEFVIFVLTGEKTTILSNPRYKPAYWTKQDINNASLDPSLFAPFVLQGDFVGKTGKYHKIIADLIPGLQLIPEQIPVIAGGPDFAVALIGTGTIKPGTACDRAGTSEGLNACIKDHINAPNLRTLPAVVDPFWNISALLPNTGQMFHNWRRASGQQNKSYAEIMVNLCSSQPTFKNKEGKQLVEQIGFAVRKAMDNLEQTIGFEPLYVLSGGQARNRLWMQLKAHITGRKLALTKTPDAELTGDAALAYTSLGIYGSLEEAVQNMVTTETIFEPNAKKHRVYTEKFNRHENLSTTG